MMSVSGIGPCWAVHTAGDTKYASSGSGRTMYREKIAAATAVASASSDPPFNAAPAGADPEGALSAGRPAAGGAAGAGRSSQVIVAATAGPPSAQVKAQGRPAVCRPTANPAATASPTLAVPSGPRQGVATES